MRRWIYQVFFCRNSRGQTVSLTHVFVQSLIFINLLAQVFGSVPWIEARAPHFFVELYSWSLYIYTAEFLLRFWTCVEERGQRHPIRGRWRWLRRPLSLIDLTVLLTFWLPPLFLDLRFLRVIRLFRSFRAIRSRPYWRSVQLFTGAINRAWPQLTVAFLIFCCFLLTFAVLMYHAERDDQPAVFSSIPAALYWAAVTLTTLGYGDVVPITPVGKLLGALAAFVAVIMFALPAGVIAAAIVEEWEISHEKEREIRKRKQNK